MSITLIELIREIMYVVIIGVLPILTKYFVAWLTAEKEKITKQTSNSAFNNSFAMAFDIVTLAVQYIQQTYVDSLKNSGKFTKEAQVTARESCVKLVKNLMNDEIKDFISVTYGDLDS
jgi:hypothetical protein